MKIKNLLTKISCFTLVGAMALTGQVFATEALGVNNFILTASAVNKALGYSSNYSMRQYDEYRLTETKGKHPLIKLLYLNNGTVYSTSGINDSRENSLGNLASARGLTASSGAVATRLENYRLFPKVYKMSFPTGKVDNKDLSKPDRITIGFNDSCIYSATNAQSISVGAYQNIRTYTGGEIELIREDVKEHILRYGAVAAKTYRSDAYFKYRTGGAVEYHRDTYDDGESSWDYDWYEKHYTPLPYLGYYCDNKNVHGSVNNNVLIVGWDDDLWIYGAPGKGAYLVKDDTAFKTSYYKDYSEGYRRRYDVYEDNIYWKVFNPEYIDSDCYYVSYYDYYIESAMYGVENISIGANPKAPYQYDSGGISTTFNISNSKAYGANVFNRKTGDKLVPEKLNAVGISNMSDARYEIYVNPTDGNLSSDKFIKVADTGILKAGYHTIDVSDKDITLIGNKFAIAVKYMAIDNSEYVDIGVQSPTEKAYTFVNGAAQEITRTIPYFSWVRSAKGQSFVGTTLDNMQDMYTYENGATKNMNLCIKAFTQDNAGFTILPESINIKYKNSNGAFVNVPNSLKVTKGDKVTFKSEVNPSNTEYKEISWETANANIAEIDVNGVLTAKSAGKTTIMARVKNATYIYKAWEVDVRVPVTSFRLNTDRVTMQDGQTVMLAGIIGPQDATFSKIEWASSNKDVVMVTENGLLIPLSKGNATVTAIIRDLDGNVVKDSNGEVFNSSCNIEVPFTAIIEVSSVSLNKSSLTLQEDSSEVLRATVAPATATNTAVDWTSSNEQIAVVNASGNVIGISPGQATIKAITKNGGKVASCVVQVTENPAKEPKGISLNKTSVQMQKDEVLDLVATITPSNTKDNFISWESTNYDVVDVDNYGKVTAIDGGIARVVATTSNGLKASCSITVIGEEETPPKAEDINLDTTGITLKQGDTQKINVTFEPIDAANQNVIWSSSDESVATVDENGVITTVGPGTATITVRTEDGNITKTCVVEVPQVIAATGISLSKTTLEVIVGRSSELTAQVLPENATNTRYNITISDESVITLSSGGIKGLKVGTATVTYTTEDGNFTATCAVTVKAVPNGNVYINSGTYDINNDEKVITEVPQDTTAGGLKDKIETNPGTTVTIKDKDGNTIENTGTVGSGTTVEIEKTEGENTVTETFTVIVNGDITGDGKVTTQDLALLRQYLLGNNNTSVYFNEKAADLNGDGEITLTDFSMLKDMFMNGGNE